VAIFLAFLLKHELVKDSQETLKKFTKSSKFDGMPRVVIKQKLRKVAHRQEFVNDKNNGAMASRK